MITFSHTVNLHSVEDVTNVPDLSRDKNEGAIEICYTYIICYWKENP